MPVSPLGERGLRELLDAGGRIVLANRVELAGDSRILSVAIVRHFADEGRESQTAYDLDIGPGESLILDPDRPRESPMVAVEVILRVVADEEGGRVAEAYSISQAREKSELRTAEFGIIDRPAVFSDGEAGVRDTDSIAVYARPA
jgi:hypothetical protein